MSAPAFHVPPWPSEQQKLPRCVLRTSKRKIVSVSEEGEVMIDLDLSPNSLKSLFLTSNPRNKSVTWLFWIVLALLVELVKLRWEVERLKDRAT